MGIEQLALLFALVVAAYLVLLVALQLPRRGRRGDRDPAETALAAHANDGLGGAATTLEGTLGPNGPPRVLSAASAVPLAVYQRVVRVASLLFTVSAMLVVVITGTGDTTSVIVLLGLALVVIAVFQDVLPQRSLGRLRLPIEAAVVIGTLTGLIVITGGHTSPFFFGYILFLGAASLWASGTGPPLLALVTSAAYMAAVLVPFNTPPTTVGDVGRVAFNLVALALVTYVASAVGREQRRAREDALRLSRFDSLTGLRSRDYFMGLLEQEILRAGRSGRAFALLMLDLDGLKAANDRFGHASGDQLLNAVAETLSRDIRVTDLAARYGGDEFVILLPETDLAGAMLVADKVRIDISRLALPHEGQVIRTSCSIGVVTYPEDGRASTELMRRADLAMYEAKRRGRDQIVRFARDANRIPMAGSPSITVAGATAAPAAEAESGLPTRSQPGALGQTQSGSEPAQMPSPTAGVIASGTYPDAAPSTEAPMSLEEQPIGASKPQFAPPPPPASTPESPIEVPPESPGKAPWESSPD